MAVLWQSSLVPFIDPSGNPYTGALATFFDAGTSTPQIVYSDSALGTSINQPVPANGNGVFPAVFLHPGSYRYRLTNSTGSVVIADVDGIDVPQSSSYVPPSAGTTDPTLLAVTGDIKAKHGKSVEAGWVRVAGRTIGNAASGATERANADCAALFAYLWTQDTTLTVSGGRGGTAVGDFAANKTIALPDYRSRGLAGLATMGGSDVALIPGAQIDGGETTDTLGATVGAATHALTIAELAAHTHTGSTDSQGAHTHDLTLPRRGGNNNAATPAASYVSDDPGSGTATGTTTSAGAHTHTVTNANTGSGTAHAIMQPSVLITFFIKL